MFRDKLSKIITRSLDKNEMDYAIAQIVVDIPREKPHGHYATPVALSIAKKNNLNPRDVAADIIATFTEEERYLFTEISIAGPGFINFTLKPKTIYAELTKIFAENIKDVYLTKYTGQKIMFEYTDPNPFKHFHIGHLMSNAIGESLSRIFASAGAEIKRANYQGDVGMHVAKSVWGLQKKLKDNQMELADLAEKNLNQRIDFLGQAYALGANSYKEDQGVKEEINALNKQIYERTDPVINNIYDAGRAWSLAYFEKIYAKLGTKFDYYYFESESAEKGMALVEDMLAQDILQKSDGAIIFPGEKFGLHNRVFVNSLGLPTYEIKDLGLAKTKYEDYPYDQSYIVTANEVDDYFTVVLKALENIYPELAAKTTHIGHGMLRFKEGKMSSRTGDVVTGETLLADVYEEVYQRMQPADFYGSEAEKEITAEKVAVGAIKYSILKQSTGKDIIFDFQQSLALEGNSGPYLQYTYARTQSLLAKNDGAVKANFDPVKTPPNAEEIEVMINLLRFGEVFADTVNTLSPHKIATYLYQLAQSYNTFYNAHPVLGSGEYENFRLELTGGVGKVLQQGLSLLGIDVVKKM